MNAKRLLSVRSKVTRLLCLTRARYINLPQILFLRVLVTRIIAGSSLLMNCNERIKVGC